MKTPILLFALAIAINCRAQFITTISGQDTSGFSGDGNLAPGALLNAPYKIHVDPTGNILFSDCANHRIRKISVNGIISTIAGTGIAGFGGNGGPASSAKLNFPYGLCSDAAGNIFVADIANARVRKIDVNGVITTVAGNGYEGYSGDGGPATSAMLNGPSDVVSDPAGNLYIGDYLNHRIRKVDVNGIITTYAGTGYPGSTGDGGPATQADIDTPIDLCLDSSGNLFFVDPNMNCARKIDNTGIITTFAGNGFAGYSGDGGLATNAMFNEPLGITLDKLGNFYIAEKTNNCIRKIDPSGIVTTIVGTGSPGLSGDGGPAITAQLYWPSGIAVHGDKIYIADWRNDRIRMVCQSLVTPSLTVSNSIVCAGAQLTLNASGANTYTYSWADGQSGISSTTVSASIPGLYYVQATEANGCRGYDSASLTVEECLGVRNEIQSNGLRLFPNPANSQVFLSDPVLTNGVYKISLLNSTGQTILVFNETGNSSPVYPIDISAVPSGFYVLLLENGKETKRSTLIKQK